MKRLMMISFATLLLASSCSEQNSDQNGLVDPNIITIDAFVPKIQKGVDATTSVLANGISIFAYKTGENYTSTPFMNDITFKKEGNVWLSIPTYYWPDYKLDFFGFYPQTVKPTKVANPSQFSYTVAANAKNQDDVVCSFAGAQERVLVPMKYHHALSKVNFKIQSYKNSGLIIKIDSISVKNIPMSADFKLITTAESVPDYFTVNNQTPENPTTGSLLQLQSPIVVDSASVTTASPVISGMYLIPHVLKNWEYGATGTKTYPLKGSYINISGSLTGVTDYTGNIAIPITTDAWQPGYSYTYVITFGQPGGSTGGGGYNPDKPDNNGGGLKPEQILMPIQVSVTVDQWIDVNPSIPPVIL